MRFNSIAEFVSCPIPYKFEEVDSAGQLLCRQRELASCLSSLRCVQETHSCFLFKSEPHCFSIDDLTKEPDGVTCWDGERELLAYYLPPSFAQ